MDSFVDRPGPNGKLCDSRGIRTRRFHGPRKKDSKGGRVPAEGGSPTPGRQSSVSGAGGSDEWMSPTLRSADQVVFMWDGARAECDVFSRRRNTYERDMLLRLGYFNDDARHVYGACARLIPLLERKLGVKHRRRFCRSVVKPRAVLGCLRGRGREFYWLDAAEREALWHFQCGASGFFFFGFPTR